MTHQTKGIGLEAETLQRRRREEDGATASMMAIRAGYFAMTRPPAAGIPIRVHIPATTSIGSLPTPTTADARTPFRRGCRSTVLERQSHDPFVWRRLQVCQVGCFVGCKADDQPERVCAAGDFMSRRRRLSAVRCAGVDRREWRSLLLHRVWMQDSPRRSHI